MQLGYEVVSEFSEKAYFEVVFLLKQILWIMYCSAYIKPMTLDTQATGILQNEVTAAKLKV